MEEPSLSFKPEPCFFNIVVFLCFYESSICWRKNIPPGKTQNSEMHKWYVSSRWRATCWWPNASVIKATASEGGGGGGDDVTLCLHRRWKSRQQKGSDGKTMGWWCAFCSAYKLESGFWITKRSLHELFIHTCNFIIIRKRHLHFVALFKKAPFPVEFHQWSFINANNGLLLWTLKDGALKVIEWESSLTA